jgi:hypothetical protein
VTRSTSPVRFSRAGRPSLAPELFRPAGCERSAVMAAVYLESAPQSRWFSPGAGPAFPGRIDFIGFAKHRIFEMEPRWRRPASERLHRK